LSKCATTTATTMAKVAAINVMKAPALSSSVGKVPSFAAAAGADHFVDTKDEEEDDDETSPPTETSIITTHAVMSNKSQLPVHARELSLQPPQTETEVENNVHVHAGVYSVPIQDVSKDNHQQQPPQPPSGIHKALDHELRKPSASAPSSPGASSSPHHFLTEASRSKSQSMPDYYDHPQEDSWFTGDGEDLLNNQSSEQPPAPPLSLYDGVKKEFFPKPPLLEQASAGQSEIMGGGGGGGGDDDKPESSYQLSCSTSEQNPTDVLPGSTGTSLNSAGTSINSSTNGSAPMHSRQGINLYSAIGSLENVNTATRGSWNKRLLTTGGRDFSRMRGPAAAVATLPSLLLPPANTQQQHQQSLLLHPLGSKTAHVLAPNQIPQTYDESSTASNHQTRTEEASNSAHLKIGPLLSQNSTFSTQPSQQQQAVHDGESLNLKSNRRSGATSKSGAAAATTAAEKTTKSRTSSKKVSYDRAGAKAGAAKAPKGSRTTTEMFRPSSDAYTPRMEKKKIKYKPAEMRTPVQKTSTSMGTLQRPNFRDALRRVAMIIHQHIVKIERRFEGNGIVGEEGLFRTSMRDAFSEDNFCTPTYRCTMVRIPMARPGMIYGLRKIRAKYEIPSEGEIYEFAHQLFKSVQLSSECSIVCIIYIERLMEIAKVPLLACTWRPIFMCGLLLASKVWQDLSSWNIEFASVYPQYSLAAINRLELTFLRMVKWDLYISSRYADENSDLFVCNRLESHESSHGRLCAHYICFFSIVKSLCQVLLCATVSGRKEGFPPAIQSHGWWS
jgi:hypothetical protein